MPVLAVDVIPSWEDTLRLIVTAAVVAGLNWWQNREGQKQAHDGAKAGAEAAVGTVAQKVDKVYETVNGSGLTGAVKRIEQGQKDHDVKDDRRFDRVFRYLGMPGEEG